MVSTWMGNPLRAGRTPQYMTWPTQPGHPCKCKLSKYQQNWGVNGRLYCRLDPYPEAGICRVSDTPGNLLELFFHLEILKILWIFAKSGNFLA